MRREKALPLLLLALVISLGGYLRLAHLGRAEFDDDDLDLYFAARSVQAGKGPVLPSGMPYVRGTDVARMIAITDNYVPNAEAAARIPSALLGTLGVMLFGAVAWALAGPWAAVLADAFLAISPELVFQSRSARFYTYQALFGLIALYAGWQVVRRMGERQAPSAETVRQQWGWAAVTLIAFALAARVQITTFSVVLGWAATVLLAAALDVRTRGLAMWRRSVPVQLTALGLGVALIAFVALLANAAPRFLQDAWTLTRHVPTWAGGVPGPTLAYYYGLSDQYPALLSLIPAIFLVLAVTRPRLCGFLFLWFAVPLALHTFVFAWKAERYVLLAMPGLFLAAGSVGATVLGALARAVRSFVSSKGVSPATASTIGGVAAGFTAAFLIISTPAFTRARKSMDTKLPGYTPGWRMAAAVLRTIPGIRQIPIGSTSPLASLRYWGRVDFTVQRGLADNAIVDTPITRRSAPSAVPLDFYGGVPVLLTPESIRAHFRGSSKVLIGVGEMALTFNNVDPQLALDLEQHGTELCHGTCGGMRLYLYPLDSAGTATVADPSDSSNASGVASGHRSALHAARGTGVAAGSG